MTQKAELTLFDIGAEKAVLGSLLIDPAAMGLDVIKALAPADFYAAKHQWLFGAMRTLHGDDKPHNDLVLLSNVLGTDKLKDLEGGGYITHLLNDTPSALRVKHYAEIVLQWAGKRRFWHALDKTVKKFHKNAPTIAADILCDELTKNLRRSVPRDYLADLEPTGSTWADLDAVIGPIKWAWRNWLPYGLLTILSGEPGSGKSALALRLGACFLRGDSWPDGTAYAGETGAILWGEAEAAQAINLSRAKRWGLPIESIVNPLTDPLGDICLDDPGQLHTIENMARRQDVKMIVIDSLSGSQRRRDENSSEILSLVRWFAELARDTGKPVIVTHHLRKRGILDADGKPSLDRLRGSSAIVQPARVIWALDCPDLEDVETKRLSVIKNNLARFADPLGLRVSEQGVTFCAAPKAPKVMTILDQAIEALRALLASGPMESDPLLEELRGMGISQSTARRAKTRLGIVVRKKAGVWSWSLPYLKKNDPEIIQ